MIWGEKSVIKQFYKHNRKKPYRPGRNPSHTLLYKRCTSTVQCTLYSTLGWSDIELFFDFWKRALCFRCNLWKSSEALRQVNKHHFKEKKWIWGPQTIWHNLSERPILHILQFTVHLLWQIFGSESSAHCIQCTVHLLRGAVLRSTNTVNWPWYTVSVLPPPWGGGRGGGGGGF